MHKIFVTDISAFNGGNDFIFGIQLLHDEFRVSSDPIFLYFSYIFRVLLYFLYFTKYSYISYIFGIFRRKR